MPGPEEKPKPKWPRLLEFPSFPDKEGGPLGRERLHAGFSGLKLGLREAQKKGDVQLSIANALWPQKNYAFRPEYLNLIERDYDSVGRAARLCECGKGPWHHQSLGRTGDQGENQGPHTVRRSRLP